MSPDNREQPVNSVQSSDGSADCDVSTPKDLLGNPSTTRDDALHGLPDTHDHAEKGGYSDFPLDHETWPVIPNFPITGVLAQGGMGIVYKARDLLLDRDVAVKTLLLRDRTSDSLTESGLAREYAQFEREARITARMSHPGIPPVHAFGKLPDSRPFLAMKLICGQTLAAELWSIDLVLEFPRLLGIFENICQTVGYAHSVGILHRDLKPGNVMVGAFGEVQVMDWGLARQIRGEEAGEAQSTLTPRDSEGGSPVTIQGYAKGTPAFMPPEQAQGDWDLVDERADVFALGCILCVLLTGRPPYTGSNVRAIHTRAAEGDLEDAFARLDGAGADAELVTLCRQCLSRSISDRPRDGKAVADAVATYRARVEERARAADMGRARAEAKALEQRKRRIVQVALTAATALLLVIGGVFLWREDLRAEQEKLQMTEFELVQARFEAQTIAAVEQARAERNLRLEDVRSRVTADIEQASMARKMFRFKDAHAALDDAVNQMDGVDVKELRSKLDAAISELEFIHEIDDIRYEHSSTETGGIRPSFLARYQVAFRKLGIDPFEESKTLGTIHKIIYSPIRDEILDAMQDWAWEGNRDLEGEEGTRFLERLFGLSSQVDRTEWRQKYYQFLSTDDRVLGQQLANEANVLQLTPRFIVFAAKAFELYQIDARPLLRRACSAHPSNFHLNFALGRLISSRMKPDGPLGQAEALGYLRAAQSIRPDHPRVAEELTMLLRYKLRDMDSALLDAERWARLKPKFDRAHLELASLRRIVGDTRGAVAAAFDAVRANPRSHTNYVQLAALLDNHDEPSSSVEYYLLAAREAAKAAQSASPDPAEAQIRASLRRQTLFWLKKHLAAQDGENARIARAKLLVDPEFASVRAFASLPEAERAEWERFWSQQHDSKNHPIPVSPPPRMVK